MESGWMTMADGFFTHTGFIDGIEGDSHFDEFFTIGHYAGMTPLVLVSLLLSTSVYHKVAKCCYVYETVGNSNYDIWRTSNNVLLWCNDNSSCTSSFDAIGKVDK